MPGQTITSLINKVSFPSSGSNLRRKISSLYDTVTLATGTTLYRPFTTAPGNIFLRNTQFPLSGQQLFWIKSISLYLNQAITTAAQYAGLLLGLQNSNLEIYVDSKQYWKIPLVECLSFNTAALIGNTSSAPLRFNPVTRNKNLVVPLLINAASNVVVNLNVDAGFASAFNANNLRISFNGFLGDVLDSSFSYNPQQGNELQDIAFTCYDTQQITTANAATFNFFAQAETNINNYSKVLPLSPTERFEIQNMELVIGGNSGITDTFDAVMNQRSTNVLTITVDDVQLHQSQVKDYLSILTQLSTTFNDAGPVLTNLVDTNLIYQSKTLETPVIIPAQGKVQVTVQQPGSSLNQNQYMTLMLKGLIKRQVN